MNLCDSKVSGMNFIVRSTLPIGAGLGSSASTFCMFIISFGTYGWLDQQTAVA